MTQANSFNYTADEMRSLSVWVGLTFVVSTLLMTLIAIVDIANELREEAEEIVTRVELIGNDSIKESQRLEHLNLGKCTPAHIAAMRGSLHRHYFIQSIRYFDGTIDCSVGDHADYDLQLPVADGTDVKGAFNVLDDPQQTIVGLESQVDNYTITYPNHLPQSFLLFDAKYEISFQRKQSNAFYHWMGNDNLQRYYQQGLLSWLPEFALVVQDCGNKYHFCASLGYSFSQLNDALIKWAPLILLVGLGAALFAFLYFKRLYLRRRSMEHRIATGVTDKSFYCEYQPIIDLNTKQIVGCEALARFRDQYGSITPLDAMPQIAASKQTIAFTHYILTTAFNEVSAIPSLPNNFKLNINVFPEDLASEPLWQSITELAANHPHLKLVIEITEDQQVNLSKSEHFTRAAQRQGIQIALDDFGTGYSNLANLQQLRCDILKIDRSFVNGLQFDSILSSLLPNIVEIANKLDMTIVAEGIETSAQYEALQRLGVEQGQGWLFGRPISAESFAKLIQKQHN